LGWLGGDYQTLPGSTRASSAGYGLGQ
jgi:hypothetical protein